MFKNTKKTKKPKRLERPKGQLSVEYFLGVALFLIVVLYLAFQLSSLFPQYLRNMKLEILRSDAYRLSEMLINDDGEPADWVGLLPGQIGRLGISKETNDQLNLLDIQKVADFTAKCAADYQYVKDKVGAEHDFYILFNDTTNVYECNSIPSGETVVIIQRVVAFDNGNYGKMILHMWW